MVTTPNKGYELIVTGAEVNTWGDKLNSNVFTFVDSNLGGVVTKSLTNVQVDLSATESQALRLVLNGTLTGNVLVTTQAVGMTIIENACTGNFTVTFQKNGVGVAVTIPNGTNNLVTTGASGNPAVVGVDFPAGTRIPFQQTTPPAGYTKDTATSGLNNSAMRLVTGTVTTGGSVDFTTALASQTPTGTVGNTTLDITQIPAHSHTLFGERTDCGGGTGSALRGPAGGFSGSPSTSSTGGGASHTHGLTMNAINLAVRYFDFVIGVKV